jgi:hypothetical protein
VTTQTPLRVALYVRQNGRGDEAVTRLRDYATSQGWRVVREFVDRGGNGNGEGRMAWRELMQLVSSPARKIDAVLVGGVGQAFDSVQEGARTLARCHRHGVTFRSYAEPLIDTARYSTGELAALAETWAALERAGGRSRDQPLFPPELTRSLREWLDIQVATGRRQEEDDQRRGQQATVRREVGRLVIWALLFAGYSAVLAAFSFGSLVGVLRVPAEVPHALESGFDSSVRFLAAVPDPVRVIVLPLLSSTALLAFRATTVSARGNVGGALFAGIVMLALLGLAATAMASPWGALVAAPGFIAAVAIVYEYCETVVRIQVLSEPPAGGVPRRGGAPPLVRLASAAGPIVARLDPARNRLIWLVFLAVPLLAVLMTAVGVVAEHAKAHWLYTPVFLARQAFIAWAMWACVATPAVVRVPIWSGLVWVVLFANFVSGQNAITYTFGVAGLAVVIINAVAFIRSKPSPPVGAQAGVRSGTS